MQREDNIHTAIKLEDVDLLRRLIDNGCDVEENEGSVTPLRQAVMKDNLEMVDVLLAAGANVNAECCSDFHVPSMQNALAYAIARSQVQRGLACTPARHEIIKRLISAGSELDVAPEFQHMYISPLQNACTVGVWPVVVDLIEAGSEVDIKDPSDRMPLALAVGLNSGFEGDCLLTWTSRRKVLGLLLEKSSTLRVKAGGMSLFRRIINGSPVGVMCMLLKADKPSYGIDEAVDALPQAARDLVVSFTEKNDVILDYNMLYTGRMCRPLELSTLRLILLMNSQHITADREHMGNIRHQFGILNLLLDARVNACHLDGNFKQLLGLVRHRINKYHNHNKEILEYVIQVLDAIESDSTNPRRLVELCRTGVRHELNIRGLCVHHIRGKVGHMMEKYLLYGDVPEPEKYMSTRECFE